MVKMSDTGFERMLLSSDSALLEHLKPFLNESRSLRMSLFLLVAFILSVLVLAVFFKVLQHFMDVPAYDDEDNVPLSKKVKKFLGGRSDIELQRLLQSSSSVPGLIFTLVGLVAIYATTGALTRLLLGLVGLGSQVVFVTWIYVESWGEFTNSLILTGTLISAAHGTLSPARCEDLGCLTIEHSWEPTLITSMYIFILATSLLHIFLAAAALLGILKMGRKVLLRRIYTTLDDHLSYIMDESVIKAHQRKGASVSESLLSELIDWCMSDKYLREMQEQVYRGKVRTQLRVVVTAIPTLVLAASAIYLRGPWRWGGATAVALLVASCSAILLGLFCVNQREHRLPLCFSRGIDIIESFENATSDLVGMGREKYDERKFEIWRDVDSEDNTLTKLFEEKGLAWNTCNYMVIQTLGLAELGHFEHQQPLWEIEKTSPDGKKIREYTDPNSSVELLKIEELSHDVAGLQERIDKIMMALTDRDPVKIGPTAISKIAGVVMAMQNAMPFLEKLERGHDAA